MTIGLGTVQFGIDYGISNKSGKSHWMSKKKFLILLKNGVDLLDTAINYGDSEKI